MAKKSGLGFMVAFVKEYLDGDMDRLGFDLDFNHYLIKHYPKMERENAGIAECFYFYISEEGFDQAQELSDTAHKELIRKQFDEFNAAMHDGIF